jgi:pSer/pThr/pTyr-binding forkhead associated (FHA) protein
MVPRQAQPGPTEAKNEPRFALRFISGKYQGGEYPLAEGQEIVIGRSSELDMVLVEEMVSRKHARIALADGTINIEDLGSTNGTFVNGEKVQQGTLREGDRVLIGTNILKVVAAPQDAEARANLKAMAVGRVTAKQQQPSGRTEETPRMSGILEEIPLPDLLQLFGTSRKAGVLVLRSAGREGRIYLNDGRIRFAEFVGVAGVPPLKVLYRMLGWQTGSFALDPPDTREFDAGIDVSAQEVLMEGFRQQDELGQLRGKLGGGGRMVLKLPLTQHLRELEDTDLDLLEAALSADGLDSFLDAVPGPDLESAQGLLSLVQRGYLKPA